MNCPVCQHPLTVHVLNPDGPDWREELYCENCRAVRGDAGQNPVCSVCGQSMANFLRNGYLGCQWCYRDLAAEIEPMIARYHGGRVPGIRAHVSSYRPDRLARARSQEVVEYIQRDVDHFIPLQATIGSDANRSQASIGEMTPPISNRIIQSVRLRMARNIEGVPYFRRLGTEERQRLVRVLLGSRAAIARVLNAFDSDQKQDLVLHDREIQRIPGCGGIAARVLSNLNLCVYVGDEDHVRIQQLFAWTDGEHILQRLNRSLQCMQQIESLFHWQFHPDFGYLTSSPGISGEALRLSVALAVPALAASSQRRTMLDRLVQAGMEVRGSQEDQKPDTFWIISNRFWPYGSDVAVEMSRMLALVSRVAATEQNLRNRI
ncbi:MAG: hypothetical protein KDK27_14325 [Leptospiraceae bacterium]|nr:hypothetical protein [Leptospiraceae bacterium]